MLKMSNVLNDENIEKIKAETDICKGICDLNKVEHECEKCVKDYLKNLLNSVGK